MMIREKSGEIISSSSVSGALSGAPVGGLRWPLRPSPAKKNSESTERTEDHGFFIFFVPIRVLCGLIDQNPIPL
jgi:hypothetical protein